MVKFSSQNFGCDAQSPALLDLCSSFDPRTCFKVAFPLLRDSDHVVISVSIGFPSNSRNHALFHCVAYDCPWDMQTAKNQL